MPPPALLNLNTLTAELVLHPALKLRSTQRCEGHIFTSVAADTYGNEGCTYIYALLAVNVLMYTVVASERVQNEWCSAAPRWTAGLQIQ